jgi:hypothetical protein
MDTKLEAPYNQRVAICTGAVSVNSFVQLQSSLRIR